MSATVTAQGRSGDHLRRRESYEKGVAQYYAEDLVAAEAFLQETVDTRPDELDALYLLARTKWKRKDLRGALRIFQRLLSEKPDFAPALTDTAQLLLEGLKNAEGAERFSRRAIEADPLYAPAYVLLGNSHLAQGNAGSACDSYHEALRINPRLADPLVNLGVLLHEKGDVAGALSHYERALHMDPSHCNAHWNRGNALLALGRLKEGWKDYEYRFRIQGPNACSCDPERFLTPWDGSPFDRRRLLVYGEQGFGDVLQFSRFLPLVKARGGTVIFECPKELLMLFKESPGIDSITSSEAPVSREAYDLAAPLLSLPALLDLGEESILWNGPYLSPDPKIVERYRGRFDGTAMKVGIVWSGSQYHRNDQTRSCSREEILRLADVGGIRLFSLQKHPDAQENSLPPEIVDLGGELEDFSITAGIIAHLDLVVTVDTAVAHLAGAMGKRVWVILPQVADWRWQINREDSPWYPSMRLFRQTTPGWTAVLDRIKTEIESISGKTASRRDEHSARISDVSVKGKETDASGIAGESPGDIERRSAGSWFEIGTRFFKEGNIPGAENAFRAALDIDPRSACARNALAVALTSRGALHEAAEELISALALDPGSAEAHYNLGNVRLKQSLYREAEVSYKSALELVPGFIEARINLASALHARKDEQGALGVLREALALQPDSPLILKQIGSLCALLQDNQSAIQAFEKALQSDATDAEAHVRVGGARLALKELEEATSSFKAAIHLDPTSAQAHAGLGATLQAQGKTEEAIQCFRRSVESAPSDATLHAQLGNALMAGGDPSGALTAFEHALRLKPDYPEILNNMGLLLKEKGNLDVAEKCYRMAIRVRPGYAPPYNNLGSLLLEKSLFCEAESCCRQALELQSDFHLARNNLANALAGQGRFEEAERLYRETIQADPSIAEVHFNLAASLANNLRFQEALSSYDNALRSRPDYPEAHLNRALISLLMGRLDEGWAGYEWRMKVRDPRRLYTAPGPDLQMWDGSDIAGKSILVRCEQGFGDTIQFSRFLPLLKERGAHVVFECHRELCGLFEGFPGVESLQAMKREPPSARFDTYVQLLSLPGLLGIRDVGSIPWPGPYIRADETRVRQWGGRIRCDRPTVGLVWAGNPIHKNDYHRSIPAQIIMPLLDTPGVKFFSLQKGKHAADLEASGRAERLDPHLLDFSETAAAIENLDLVIAVDTAVAHLAGAMGKPVWTLLPYRPDWRWLLERSDSPWYPSMKLFRQSAHGDWPSVIGVVSSELRRFLESAVIRRIRPEVAGARP